MGSQGHSFSEEVDVGDGTEVGCNSKCFVAGNKGSWDLSLICGSKLGMLAT